MNIFTPATAYHCPLGSIWDLEILMTLPYLAKQMFSSESFGVSPNPTAKRGKKSHYIMTRLKSHYNTDNLNMMDTMMPTKMMMIMSVMMSVVMLVFVDLGKCSAKSSAVEEGDIII